MTEGCGFMTWWGFSPALDFLYEIGASEKIKTKEVLCGEAQQNLNILMVGAGDSRHIVKTISQAHRHKEININFFIIEHSMDLYARHLLLLNIATELPEKYGLQEKMELYLEVFGNTFVRYQTYEYVQNKASEFIRMVTDLSYMKEKFPLINIELLKYKEVDALESIFKFWRNPDKETFDISKYWDIRIRKALGTRYDSRKGIYDWDFNMKLIDRNAAIIGIRKYYKWRETGIAFEIREGLYNFPNKTLFSEIVIKRAGEKYFQRGYWGDIISSPYLAFGIECENETYLKKVNDTYAKTGEDISSYNILALLHELAYKEKYSGDLQNEVTLRNKNDKRETFDVIEEEDEDVEENPDIPIKTCSAEKLENVIPNKEEKKECMNLDYANIIFLPTDSMSKLHEKPKYENFFDVIYFSNSMVHNLKPETCKIMSPDAIIILETAKFMLDLRAEHAKEFLKKITGMAKEANCEPVTTCDPVKDAFATFVHTKKDKAAS